MTETAILSLGGNVGDVVAAFARALVSLKSEKRVQLRSLSSIWRTKPWGLTNQPDFLNMAVKLKTILPPEQLLQLCQQIEESNGRVRGVQWGPRTLDIDIIVLGDLQIVSEGLTLPHPRAHERLFVLAPMAEIAADAVIAQKSVSNWLAQHMTLDAETQDHARSVRIDEKATAQLAALLKN